MGGVAARLPQERSVRIGCIAPAHGRPAAGHLAKRKTQVPDRPLSPGGARQPEPNGARANAVRAEASAPLARASPTRKRGLLVVGAAVVICLSSVQATVATSSGDAEHHAKVQAVAGWLGLQAVALGFGWALQLRMRVDPSASVAVASRNGLG